MRYLNSKPDKTLIEFRRRGICTPFSVWNSKIATIIFISQLHFCKFKFKHLFCTNTSKKSTKRIAYRYILHLSSQYTRLLYTLIDMY